MSLEANINEDLKTAMKAKDQAALRGIRAIKSAILLYNTSGSAEALTEEKEIALLQKLIKHSANVRFRLPMDGRGCIFWPNGCSLQRDE